MSDKKSSPAHLGRIPRAFIDDLLARTDIVDLINSRLPLRKAGANFVACCPFHDEKTPSFTVSPSKQIYHCFGCAVSGNALGFIMAYERLEFIDAVESLAKYHSLDVPYEGNINKNYSRDSNKHLYHTLELVNQFYQQQLRQSPQAIQYLKQRGLTGQIAKQFCLGFSLNSWDNLIKAIGNTKEQFNDLITAGLILKNNHGKYYDRFRDRVMFPIRDKAGHVIGFGGRVIDNSLPKYLNSPETKLFHKGKELYGLYEARISNRELNYIIVVEGYMDVIALAQAGITQVVATLGTATTNNHIQQLSRYTQKIIFCFDGDKAGKAAAWRALEITLPILQEGMQVHFLFLPDGEDPDSMIKKENTAGFLQRVDQAIALPDFFFNTLSAQVNDNSLEGRARFTKLALPYLNNMSSPILQEIMLDRLAEIVRLDRQRLNYFANNDNSVSRVNNTKSQRQPLKNIKKNAQLSPMRFAIALLLQQPKLLGSIADPNDLRHLTLPGSNLFYHLLTLLQENPELNTGALLEYWRDQAEYSQLIKLATWELNVPAEGIVAEFQGIIQRLKQLQHEYYIDQLLAKAKQDNLTVAEKELLQELLTSK